MIGSVVNLLEVTRTNSTLKKSIVNNSVWSKLFFTFPRYSRHYLQWCLRLGLWGRGNLRHARPLVQPRLKQDHVDRVQWHRRWDHATTGRVDAVSIFLYQHAWHDSWLWHLTVDSLSLCYFEGGGNLDRWKSNQKWKKIYYNYKTNNSKLKDSLILFFLQYKSMEIKSNMVEIPHKCQNMRKKPPKMSKQLLLHFND